MKKLFLFVLTFVALNNVSAQWKKLSTGTTRNLNGTYFLNSNLGYAVGDMGAITRTIDGGVNWTGQNAHVLAKLYSVFFTDSLNGYIVGDSATLLITNDAGLNWVKQPLGISPNVAFYAVYFTNDSTGYITSNSYETTSNSSILLRTTNKWQSWFTDTLGIGVTSSICFPTKDTGYIVGNCIRKTTNAGVEWKSESFNAVNLNCITQNTYFPDNIVAVGDGGKIVYGTPTAKQFNVISPGTTANLNFITYDGYYHKYFVVGDNGSLFMNSDLSNPINTWTQVSTGVTVNLNAVSTIDQSNYSNIIVGDSGTILRTLDGGTNWTKLNSGVVNNLNSIAGEHGSWADYSYIVGDNGTILQLYNSTVTHIQTSLTTKKLNFICKHEYSYQDIYYVVGEKGLIFKANSNWTSCTFQNVDTAIDLTYIHFYEANGTVTGYGFAVGFDNARNESVILYTSNYGTTWNKKYSGITSKIKGGSGQNLFIAGEDGTILFDPKETYQVSYNYKYWDHYNTLTNTQDLGAVFFTSKDSGYAINRSSDLFKTIDGGKNWSLITMTNIRSLYFTNRQTGYVVGLAGKIMKSTNSGSTWTAQTSGATASLNNVYFPNKNVGYAVGNSGTIVKTWTFEVNSPTICLGDTAILTADEQAMSYNWSNGDTGRTIKVSPNTSTAYTVTAHGTLGFIYTQTATVTVRQPATITTSVNQPLIAPGQSANVCASGSATYTWNTGQTTACISVSPTTTTTYSVIGVDQCGFIDTATAVVNVGFMDVGSAVNKSGSKFLLYPLPAKEQLIIESSQPIKGNVVVYNTNGLEVITHPLKERKTQLDLSKLSSGIYFINLLTDKGNEVRKIMKE